MGMYDTFYGKIKCPICGEFHEFEDQTKSYECMLDDFKLGDYIGRDDEYYIEPIECYCRKGLENERYDYKYIKDKNREFRAGVVIVSGQIVKFANEEELKDIDVYKMENIEYGLGRKQDYLDKCKIGIGINNDLGGFLRVKFRNETIIWEEHPKKVGDKLFTFNNEWIIKEVYKELLVEDKFLSAIHYKDNYIYRITGILGDRIAKVTKNYIRLYYDVGFDKDYNYDNYHVSNGCELVKITDTYNVDNELIEYFVVNKDLNVLSGKIAAQVGHVATIIAMEEYKQPEFKEWYDSGI